MFCSACHDDESLLQMNSGYERLITMDMSQGSLTGTPAIWQLSKRQLTDGYYCSRCKTAIKLPPKLVAGWHLNDSPVAAISTIDLNELVASLAKVAHGAKLNLNSSDAIEGSYGSIESVQAKIPRVLLERLRSGLKVDPGKLYSHQVQALDLAFAGKNVVLQTPTASGKSLCYLLPVFTRLLKDKDATALFVYPMKALAFDQRKKIAAFSEGFNQQRLQDARFAWPLKFGKSEVWVGAYERETKGADQEEVKQMARIVLTNPDSLHAKILPWFETRTGSWERFLSNLKFVVLDEIHSYRGLFGAHVAYVVRRLRLMCDQLGTSPQFFCASATLSSPKQHAEDLVGLPFESIEASGSPQFKRTFVLWNPGMGEKKDSGRREPTSDAIDILREVLLKPPQPIQTITFIRSLAGVERFNDTLRNNLAAARSPFTDKTRTYKSQLTLQSRNSVSEGLASGQIVHVAATNALELGIDIGDMNCCLMIGYPGTVSSTLQQSGRVGRKGDSVVILLLRDEPLEQWFARNPSEFFANIRKCEPIRLPINNPWVLEQQVKCAVWDLHNSHDHKTPFDGMTSELLEKYFGSNAMRTVTELAKNKDLQPIRGGLGTFWLIVRKNYEDNVPTNIRVPISIGKFAVLDESHKLVGECDSTIVPRDLFPGAIWMNEGKYFESKAISINEKTVRVRRLPNRPDHFTIALPQTTLSCLEESSKTRASKGCILGRGHVKVKRQVRLYKSYPSSSEKIEGGATKTTLTTPIEYESTAFWLDIPRKLLDQCQIGTDRALSMIHALEHSVRTVFPMVADIDPGDLGSSVEVSDTPESFKCRLYVFDSFAGGTGLSEFAFDKPGVLFKAAYDLLESCHCKTPEGCPRCTIIPWCESQNADLDKTAAKAVLSTLRTMK
jgi:DEAD/DEAH box helicase domain-containing protein